MSTPRRTPIIRAGPKRRIERFNSKGSVSGNASVQSVTLHTCEDAKTLVNTRGLFVYHPSVAGSDANVVCDWVIAIAPAGTSVINASTAGASDGVVSNLVVARGRLQATGTYSGGNLICGIGDRQEILTKAMRKMKENDLLVLSYVMSSAQGNLVYSIDLHFKE